MNTVSFSFVDVKPYTALFCTMSTFTQTSGESSKTSLLSNHEWELIYYLHTSFLALTQVEYRYNVVVLS